ncbi:MAG: tyrosine--tRNA ligase [Candidatus Bathyarchaeia archaeon]|jgi:tyrosyl-tRNA synthetase|nr:tyrosine--tRNA ligase [Candidatus Bathyarchaeota archaeon]
MERRRTLDVEERLELVTRNTQEIVTKDELQTVLETKTQPRAYWGFESSGLMHIGMGLVCGGKIKDIINAGFHFIIFLADWHSWINNKLGGKMENIHTCGEYFKECFTALGITPQKAQFLWATDLAKDIEYWEKVIRIGKTATLQRVWRALPIMGREMSLSDMETAWVYYPCMQAADIFHMELDVACAGIDQRKAHMLARDAAEKLHWKKPVCVHVPLLMGLQGPAKTEKEFDENGAINLQISAKMSKSMPENCIFVHDSPEQIRSKVKNAYCPPKQTESNPVLELAKLAIFTHQNNLTIERPAKYGRNQTFKNFAELEKAFREGKVHPLDLKNGVAEALITILEPVRKHFQKKPDMLEKMLQIEITR